jgi:hypothetical protein
LTILEQTLSMNFEDEQGRHQVMGTTGTLDFGWPWLDGHPTLQNFKVFFQSISGKTGERVHSKWKGRRESSEFKQSSTLSVIS